MKLYELSNAPEYILESIFTVNDNITLSTTKWKETSTIDSISTSFKRIPYKTRFKGSETIWSVLNYISSDQSTKILQSLKGNGPYTVSEKQIDQLLTGAIQSCHHLFAAIKPEVIIYPKSSSDLLKKFINKIKTTYPNIEVLDEAFVKKLLISGDEEALINTSHPDWVKFSEKNPKAVDELKKSLSRQIDDGHLELKKLYKPYVKFIKNFVELEDAYKTVERVINRNVVVVDDILSTGATMLEMFRQLREFEPSNLCGLTLFKRSEHTLS